MNILLIKDHSVNYNEEIFVQSSAFGGVFITHQCSSILLIKCSKLYWREFLDQKTDRRQIRTNQLLRQTLFELMDEKA